MLSFHVWLGLHCDFFWYPHQYLYACVTAESSTWTVLTVCIKYYTVCYGLRLEILWSDTLYFTLYCFLIRVCILRSPIAQHFNKLTREENHCCIQAPNETISNNIANLLVIELSAVCVLKKPGIKMSAITLYSVGNMYMTSGILATHCVSTLVSFWIEMIKHGLWKNSVLRCEVFKHEPCIFLNCLALYHLLSFLAFIKKLIMWFCFSSYWPSGSLKENLLSSRKQLCRLWTVFWKGAITLTCEGRKGNIFKLSFI